MKFSDNSRPRMAIVMAIIAVLFGAMTLYSGGAVLFVDGQGRAAAGNFVPFVLWFNFAAGFAYIAAGIGLFLWREWAIKLSMLIAGLTVLVALGFSVHVLLGGSFEPRTVGALGLRSAVWLVIAFFSRAAWKARQPAS